MRLLVDGFVSNARKADGRLKRGGAFEAVPLEETMPDGQVRSHDRRSSRTTTRCSIGNGSARCSKRRSTTCDRGEARGREVQFEVFRRYDLADVRDEAQPTYADLAAGLGLTVATVTNHLAAMRRALRARVLERLRELTASDDEYEAEAKRLLGVRR